LKFKYTFHHFTKFFFVLSALTFIHLPIAHAKKWKDYQPDLQPGEYCKTPLTIIHPTQLPIGQIESKARTKDLLAMSKRKLEKYLHQSELIAPIVIDPNGVPWIIDHHHLGHSLLNSGLKKTLRSIVWANFSNLTAYRFKQEMLRRHWVYLYDQNGEPIEFEDLPTRFQDMKNDRYRSLVWSLRGLDVLRKVATPHSQFRVANFLRERVKMSPGKSGYLNALHESVPIVLSPEAKDLPGFIGCGSFLVQNNLKIRM